jgi:hypothetical protein
VVLTYLLGWATKWSHIPKTTHCSPGSSCNWGAHPPRWHRCAPPKSRPLAQENSGGIPRTSLNRKHCHDKAIWCYMKFKVIFGEHFLEDQSCFLVQFLYIYIWPHKCKSIYRHGPSVVPMEKWFVWTWDTNNCYRLWCEHIPHLWKKSLNWAAAPFLDKSILDICSGFGYLLHHPHCWVWK